jgi:hypothetical protein
MSKGLSKDMLYRMKDKKYFFSISQQNPFNIFYIKKDYDSNIDVINTTNNTNNIKIIITRYNESLNWAKKFNNVLLYNKGNQNDPILNDFNYINIPNVGRDIHTIFYHIYHNYDSLDDYLVFLQGFAHDHSPNLNKNMNKIINQINNNEHIHNLYEDLSELVLDGKIFCHESIDIMDKVYERIFGEKMGDKKIIFGSGAQFIVSRHNILKRSRDFYKNIMDILDYSNMPYEIFEVERFIQVIFNL